MPNFVLRFTKLKHGRDRARSNCNASQGLARDTDTDPDTSAVTSTSTSTSAGTGTGIGTSTTRPSLSRADLDNPKRAGRLKLKFKSFFGSRKKASNTITDARDQSLTIQGDHHDQHGITTVLVPTPSSSYPSVASRPRTPTVLVPTPSSSYPSVASRPRTPPGQTNLCTEEQEALEVLHEALHHHSVLDVTRHLRHSLLEVIFEPRPSPIFHPILGCIPSPLLSISTQALSRVVLANESQPALSIAPTSLEKRRSTWTVASSHTASSRGPALEASTTLIARTQCTRSTSGTGISSNSSRRASPTTSERQRGVLAAVRPSKSLQITSETNTVPFPCIQSRRGSSSGSHSSIRSLVSHRPHSRSHSGYNIANRASTALDVHTPGSDATSLRSMRENVSPRVHADDAEHENASRSPPRIPTAADMRVLRFLAEGTSGKVYHVEDRVTRARVALKVIGKADKPDFMLDILLAERNISEKLADCSWFVKLYCSWHDHKYLYMAMTLYPTDLDSELIKFEKFHPDRARFYMAEIIIALCELHTRGIIHRDVKAPNILIDRAGHIVLADFGLSKDFDKRPSIPERIYQPFWPYLADERPTSDTPRRSAEDLHFVSWDYRGSELEMAPEIHLRQPYSFGVDFWSAAVVLYWMLTGRPPWYEEEEDEDEDEQDGDKGTVSSSSASSRPYKSKPVALKVIEDDVWWDEEDDVDDITKEFVEQMLHKNPASRPVISYQMPHHAYFASIDWPAMEARRIPAPWLPEHEVCHAYEATSPTFSPGTPYGPGECDPHPGFTFASEEASQRAGVVPTASMVGSDDSDRSEAAEIVTVAVRRRTAHGSESKADDDDASADGPVGADLTDEDAQEVVEAEEEPRAELDHAMVNPPPTSPLGPGPEQGMQPEDLQEIPSAPNSPHSSISISPSPRPLSPPLPSRLSPSPSPPASSPSPPPSPSPSPPPSPSVSPSASAFPSLSRSPSPSLSRSPSPSPSHMASDSESVEVMYISRTSSSDALADIHASHHTPSGSSSRTRTPPPPPSSSPPPSPSPSPSPAASRRRSTFAKFKALVSKLGKRSGNK